MTSLDEMGIIPECDAAREEEEELLALAARARGDLEYIEGQGWIELMPDGSHGSWWNPLDDDGTAFRLLVNLRMEIAEGTDDRGQTEWWAGYPSGSGRIKYMCQAIGDDPAKSARLAIVRAAAEIGRRMES